MRENLRWSVLPILVAVFAALFPALGAGFNWDDPVYVQGNSAIRDLSLDGLVRIFSEPVVANYTPLTTLSLAFDYHIAGGPDTGVFHLTSVLLHLVNVVLVQRLVRRLGGSEQAAWVAALLFGIHPLRVESVAWISARKDVLYGMFYLAALICYTKHTGRQRPGWDYAASLVLFLCSLLSKGMAVSLPLVLVLLDYLTGRPVSRRTLLEKLPFFALAILFGAISITVKQGVGAHEQEALRSLFERVQLAGFALWFYIWKQLVPLKLSALYPYPDYPPGALPLRFLFFPGLSVVVAGLVAYSAKFTRKIVFGALFFFCNVVFVLQLMPIGGVIAADRYTYLASVGLAYLVGAGFTRIGSRRRPARIALVLVVATALLLGGASWQRSELWKDREGLFSDVIAQYPRLQPAYLIRASERAERGEFAAAMRDYDAAIRLDPGSARAYFLRGNAHADSGNPGAAVADYRRALEIKPRHASAHYNLGYVLGDLGDLGGAVREFTLALENDPEMLDAYLNRADAYRWLGRHGLAVADYDVVVDRDPSRGAAFHGRADSLHRLGEVARAGDDLERAAALGYPIDPKLRQRLASDNVR